MKKTESGHVSKDLSMTNIFNIKTPLKEFTCTFMGGPVNYQLVSRHF